MDTPHSDVPNPEFARLRAFVDQLVAGRPIFVSRSAPFHHIELYGIAPLVAGARPVYLDGERVGTILIDPFGPPPVYIPEEAPEQAFPLTRVGFELRPGSPVFRLHFDRLRGWKLPELEPLW